MVVSPCDAPTHPTTPTPVPLSHDQPPLPPARHQHELAFFSGSSDAAGPRHPIPKLIFLEGMLAPTLAQLKDKPAASAPDGRVRAAALAEALQIPQEQATLAYLHARPN
jgi:TBCC domain-containing protein 1|uniref:Uncharacterized protein n=1 Tax=Zea mays TaxID=4577 RepID=A0A804QMP0_MAIZE